jgi:hypothetical protein
LSKPWVPTELRAIQRHGSQQPRFRALSLPARPRSRRPADRPRRARELAIDGSAESAHVAALLCPYSSRQPRSTLEPAADPQDLRKLRLSDPSGSRRPSLWSSRATFPAGEETRRSLSGTDSREAFLSETGSCSSSGSTSPCRSSTSTISRWRTRGASARCDRRPPARPGDRGRRRRAPGSQAARPTALRARPVGSRHQPRRLPRPARGARQRHAARALAGARHDGGATTKARLDPRRARRRFRAR